MSHAKSDILKAAEVIKKQQIDTEIKNDLLATLKSQGNIILHINTKESMGSLTVSPLDEHAVTMLVNLVNHVYDTKDREHEDTLYELGFGDRPAHKHMIFKAREALEAKGFELQNATDGYEDWVFGISDNDMITLTINLQNFTYYAMFAVSTSPEDEYENYDPKISGGLKDLDQPRLHWIIGQYDRQTALKGAG